MVTILSSALLILWMGGAVSCSFHREIPIYIEPGIEEYGEILPPLPKGFSWKRIEKKGTVPANNELDAIPFLLICEGFPTRSIGSAFEKQSVLQDELKRGDLKKTLKTIPFAPETSFLDPRTNIQKEEVKGFSLVPLDSIQLPNKALRVNGLFPGEEGYPYLGQVILRVRFEHLNASQDQKETLLHWFQSIPEPELPRIARVAAVGDIMAGRGVERLLQQGENGLKAVFGDTLLILQSHDLSLGNLEGAVTHGEKALKKSYTFKFPPEILPPLKQAGFQYLSVVNNHVFDYGEEGFLNTLKALQEIGIGTSGVGRNVEEASKPWKFYIDSLLVQVLSVGAYPPEPGKFDGKKDAAARTDKSGILWEGEEALQSMSSNFSSNSFDVVMVHGGYEWAETPQRKLRLLYRSWIEAGADIVVGSHPHVLQGMEVYKGKLIAYSLGNFIFPGMDETKYGEDSCILSLGLYGGEVRYLEVYPVRLQATSVRLDPSSRIVERFYRLSEALR